VLLADVAGLAPKIAATMLWEYLLVVERLLGQPAGERAKLLTDKPPKWNPLWGPDEGTGVKPQATPEYDAWQVIKNDQEQALIRSMPYLNVLVGMPRDERWKNHASIQQVVRNFRKGA
jgi:hypothetical protein